MTRVPKPPPPPPSRTPSRSKQFLATIFVLILFQRANLMLYEFATTPGKINIHKKLTQELQQSIVQSILFWFMFIQGILILLLLSFGLSRCMRGFIHCAKWSMLVAVGLGIYSYVRIKMEHERFELLMTTASENSDSICQFPSYFPGWLWPPLVVPFFQQWLLYNMNEPWFEPTPPSFAKLETSFTSSSSTSISATSTAPSIFSMLSFPGCLATQGLTPSFVLHPAVTLFSKNDIPPIGSGIGDYEHKVVDGVTASLLHIASITKEEGQVYNVSFSTPLKPGQTSVTVDDSTVGLIQAFCTDKKGRVEEQVLVHVPELPRLRRVVRTSNSKDTACPFSLTIVLIDSVSLAKAKRVWPKFWAELDKIGQTKSSTEQHDNSGRGSSRRSSNEHLRTSTTTTTSSSSSSSSSVFNFARFHALGMFSRGHIATGFNLRPLFTGRTQRMGSGGLGAGLHRPPNETTTFWEEMRERTGHASWWANGMCANYGNYIDRAKMWTDVEFNALGCHLDYDQGGAEGRNFNGPYSVFPRYIAGVPVHRHLFSYQRTWRKRYGNAAKVPTIGIMNFLEAHEGLEQVVKTMDEDLVEFLHDMKETGSLEDTMVVFLSDHGNDMGVKELWQEESWIEKTHPFMTMVVPDALLARIGPDARASLEKNTQRLVTLYDVHRTFLSMCSDSGSAVDSMSGRQVLGDIRNNEGPVADGPYSLFHEEVPLGRSCRDALIPESICRCKHTEHGGKW